MNDEVVSVVRIGSGDLDGYTNKLDIGTSSIYVTVGMIDGFMRHIDITLSRGDGDKTMYNSDVEAIELHRYDLARSWIEDSCRQASKLLQYGASVSEVVDMWMGTRGLPNGVCVQLETIVPGPLHAAAMLISRNVNRWESLS